jgi:DNA topoisomerase-1
MNDRAKAREAIERGRRGKWWRRIGSKSRGFKYTDAEGKALTKKEELERINSLVIPPAWKHVRICPSPGGRLQAVGMDTTGRVQYIYHPKFAERNQRNKFAKIERFGSFLPKLRKTTNEDIAADGLAREKILAVSLRLINFLYFRVGTEGSAATYKTYGLTTLKNDHLTIGANGKLTFDFVGKSHVQHRKVIVDEELAKIMRELKKIGPKRKLFHYLNEAGKPIPIKPSDINAYLKAATDPEFSSKDFRTWGGSLLAATKLAGLGVPPEEAATKKAIVKVVRSVAEELGNTPAVCRSSYIHPAVFKAYESGMTIDLGNDKNHRRIKKIEHEEPNEKALLDLFKKMRGE